MNTPPPASSSPPDGLRSGRFVAVLGCTLAGFTGYNLLLPVVPLWATHGGGGPAAAGATTAVFMAVTVLTQLAVPVLLRRASHRLVLLLGCILLGLPSLGYALSDALGWLLLVSAVRGIGFGLMTVLGSTLVAELLPASAYGRGSGRYGAMIGLSTVVCLPLGIYLAEHVGFTLVFILAMVFSGLAAALAWLVGATPHAAPQVAAAGRSAPGPRGIRARRQRDLGGQQNLGSHGSPGGNRPPNRGQRSPLLAPWLVMIAGSVSSAIVVTFAADVFSAAQTSVALLAFGLAVTAGRLIAGVLNDRSKRPSLVLPGHAALVLGAGSAALAASGVAVWPLLILAAVLLAAGFGALQNDTLVAMFSAVPATGYARASVVWNIGYDGGTGLGSLAIGALALAGYPTAFGIVTVFAALLLPAAVALRRR